jgi:hypothetical protein
MLAMILLLNLAETGNEFDEIELCSSPFKRYDEFYPRILRDLTGCSPLVSFTFGFERLFDFFIIKFDRLSLKSIDSKDSGI